MSDTEKHEDPPERQNSGRSELVRKGPLLSGILLGFILLGQLVSPWTDRQMTNIASMAMLVVASVLLLSWWMNRFEDHGPIRWAPLAAVISGLSLFAIYYQYDGVSGELVPSFVPRTLGKQPLPEVVASAGGPALPEQQTMDRFGGFLGNHRSGLVSTREFSINFQQSPERLFRQPIGEGWSGVAIAGSRGFTMEQRGPEECVTCYDLDTGNLLWKHSENARHENVLGGIGPRSTPSLVDTRFLISQGATGIVLCLNQSDGSVKWRVDLLELTDTSQLDSEQIVSWGRSGSPLVLEQRVILPLGGAGNSVSALVALDLESGNVVWKSKRNQPGGGQISYASPIRVDLAGETLILSVNESELAVYGTDGQLRQTYDWPGSSNGGANCSQPTLTSDSGVLLSKGYGGGGMLLKLARNDQDITIEAQWQVRSILKTKFTNPVILDGYAYALSDGMLECVDVAKGLRIWRQPRRDRYQHGQLLLIEDVLLISTEDGRVALVRARPDDFEQLAVFQAIEGKTWNIPSVAGRRLVVRNAKEMSAFMLPPREKTQ